MTQKDKELLLKDLCARLPYRVHCCVYNMNGSLRIEDDVIYYCADVNVVTYNSFENECFMLWQIKPYLRPMLSMTDEEKEELLNRLPKYWSLEIDKLGDLYFDICDISYPDIELLTDIIDWLNAHHFDYRRLIEKGLALKAPKGMYK